LGIIFYKINGGINNSELMTMRRNKLLVLLIMYLTTSAVRADFNSGVVACVMNDYEKCFTIMQSLAETSDHGHAQYFMGVMYQKGQGVNQDFKKASDWYRKASEKAIPQAQYKLGELYFNGQGVPKDYESAYIWFSVGASHTHKLSIDAIKKAKAKLSDDELKEAGKVIATYVKQFGPQEDIDPTKPIKIDNE
tara:strand:- start:315 stop:893 length:579 start_codon:yes stop_codon:yes gene_type:complete